MTLQEYKEKNEAKLKQDWIDFGQDDFANYESFCFYQWHNSGVAEVA